MAAFALSSSLTPKTLTPSLSCPKPSLTPSSFPVPQSWNRRSWSSFRSRQRQSFARAAVNSDFSSRRSSSEQRETIMLPGCDYNHWLIVMDFPKDPAPSREQMIDAYLNTLATVLGSMEEAKKNMYAFSTTTYTGFQCTVDEATSEKFKGLPGVLWVLPDSYIDVKNKDYGGDKYVNGEIIPCTYPTYQPKQRKSSKYESKRYERRRDGPPANQRSPSKPQSASSPESSSSA
ncbi:unnamed protein product [Linum tenue]|uniref:MORF/ORRM1/DAG-like MORF domain-containing protein n=1 Tax=Linum tenue TaxID=586396 RepID=A0AAV0JDM8_9ROSI|nr:unnamed protein product [Linum tenue]